MAETKLKTQSLLEAVLSGWQFIKATGTRTASVDTGDETYQEFTIAGDWTAIISVGDPLRYKQGGSFKYGYVTKKPTYSAPNTTIRTSGGSDYSVASGSLTDIYYSKSSCPGGFPDFFNYRVNWSANSGAPSIGNGAVAGRFSMKGCWMLVEIKLSIGNTTTTGTGGWRFSFPAQAANVADLSCFGGGFANNNGVANFAQITQCDANATYFHFLNQDGGDTQGSHPFTFGAVDALLGSITIPVSVA